VHIDVFAGTLMQLGAADLFGEVGNANGVAGVQLLHEEVAAGADDAVDPAMAALELRLRRPGPGASIAARRGGGAERAQVTMTKQSRAPAVSE